MHTVKIDHMNLNQIANSGQCFRWKQVNNNTYKIPAFGKEITISQNNAYSLFHVMKQNGIKYGIIISI